MHIANLASQRRCTYMHPESALYISHVSLSSSSSSLTAIAHKPKGPREYFSHHIALFWGGEGALIIVFRLNIVKSIFLHILLCIQRTKGISRTHLSNSVVVESFPNYSPARYSPKNNSGRRSNEPLAYERQSNHGITT